MTSLSMIFGYRFFISSFLLHTCFPFQHTWHPLHSNIFKSPRKIDSVMAPASRAPSKIRDTMTCVFPFFRGLPMIPSMFFLISTCPHNVPVKPPRDWFPPTQSDLNTLGGKRGRLQPLVMCNLSYFRRFFHGAWSIRPFPGFTMPPYLFF